MRRITYITSIIIMVLAFAFIGLNLYWLIFPTKVVEFNQIPFPVVNADKEVVAGGELQYVADLCKYIEKEGTATTSFIDGVVWLTGTVTTNKESGCTSRIQVARVPANLPAGEYRYRILLVYKLNPIRTESYVIETEEFLVVK